MCFNSKTLIKTTNINLKLEVKTTKITNRNLKTFFRAQKFGTKIGTIWAQQQLQNKLSKHNKCFAKKFVPFSYKTRAKTIKMGNKRN